MLVDLPIVIWKMGLNGRYLVGSTAFQSKPFNGSILRGSLDRFPARLGLDDAGTLRRPDDV
jgi:hypothetical protein